MFKRNHLTEIFEAALKRVDPYQMIIDHVHLNNEILEVKFEDENYFVNLKDYKKILILGAGKASARMAKAIEEILGHRISDGLIAVKYGHSNLLRRINIIEAGHPSPDEQSVAAAKAIANLACQANKDTLVINLISGGGSSLLCLPVTSPFPLTLGDKQVTTNALLACGADIREINVVRKHLSGIKGGRLLQMIAPAKSYNFILSDVVGDHLDSIASGLTHHDKNSFADPLAIIKKYQLTSQLPENVIKTLEHKTKDEMFETATTTNILVGTNQAALLAACEKARSLSYNTQILTSSLTGEAREAARFLFAIASDIRKNQLLIKKPAFVIAGGETVVTLVGKGKGGRNQEMALAFLAEMAKDRDKGKSISFLSAATDGGDGPTDAAGAFADTEMLESSLLAGLSITDTLAKNDSWTFFDKIQGLLKTGPTMTNVCDLQMFIVE